MIDDRIHFKRSCTLWFKCKPLLFVPCYVVALHYFKLKEKVGNQVKHVLVIH